MSAVLARVSAHQHSIAERTKVFNSIGRKKNIDRRGGSSRCSVCANAIRTNDGTLCGFSADYHSLFRVGYAASLDDYLQILATRITNFDLPLGASLQTLPCGQVVLQVPKVTFMDLFVYPTSTLEIRHAEGAGALIYALDTEIHGSHHVESLNCNDRFEMKLDVVLKAKDDTWVPSRMDAKAHFKLDVDVPFPLNVTPKPVIESAGNVAVQRTLTSLMDTLCKSIVRDQIAWTKDQAALVAEPSEALVGAQA